MRKPFVLFLLMLLASPATAQDTFTFEAVHGFVWVRIEAEGGDTVVEYLAPNYDGLLTCVALDADGQPFAVERNIDNDGDFTFFDVARDDIENILCQFEEE